MQGFPCKPDHDRIMIIAETATMAAAQGVNPIVIQHQMGHADLRTTQASYLGTPPPDLLADYAGAFG